MILEADLDLITKTTNISAPRKHNRINYPDARFNPAPLNMETCCWHASDIESGELKTRYGVQTFHTVIAFQDHIQTFCEHTGLRARDLTACNTVPHKPKTLTLIPELAPGILHPAAAPPGKTIC